MISFLSWALFITCALLFILAGIVSAMAKDLLHLTDVGCKLYRRAAWRSEEVSVYERDCLWDEFRDALHLPKGSVLGAGDPHA